jgi:hypothetical protein
VAIFNTCDRCRMESSFLPRIVNDFAQEGIAWPRWEAESVSLRGSCLEAQVNFFACGHGGSKSTGK